LAWQHNLSHPASSQTHLNQFHNDSVKPRKGPRMLVTQDYVVSSLLMSMNISSRSAATFELGDWADADRHDSSASASGNSCTTYYSVCSKKRTQLTVLCKTYRRPCRVHIRQDQSPPLIPPPAFVWLAKGWLWNLKGLRNYPPEDPSLPSLRRQSFYLVWHTVC
jgi:hypothetical protein